MATFYVVPDNQGYGSWAIKKEGQGKIANGQTQATATNSVRSQYGKQGDQVYVYGSRNKQIVESFTIS